MLENPLISLLKANLLHFREYNVLVFISDSQFYASKISK